MKTIAIVGSKNNRMAAPSRTTPLKVRYGEHIAISPLTIQMTKPSRESAIRDCRQICNKIPSFEELTILAYENHKYLNHKKTCSLGLIDLF